MMTYKEAFAAARMMMVGGVVMVGPTVTADAGPPITAPHIDVVNVAQAEVDQSIATVPIRISVVPSDNTHTELTRMTVRLRPRSVRYASSRATGGDRDARSIDPRGFGTILRYSPTTATVAAVSEPSVVRTVHRRDATGGLSLDAAYGSMVQGHGGLDRSRGEERTVETKQHVAPVAAVTAGTFDRGRGVVFQFKSTPQGLIGGERELTLVTPVGSQWRGGIVDVAITVETRTTPSGSSTNRSWDGRWAGAAGGDPPGQTRTFQKRFAVAVADAAQGDAVRDAAVVSRREHHLRTAGRQIEMTEDNLWTKWTDHWSQHLPLPTRSGQRSESAPQSWVERLIAGVADPHHDSTIAGLPMVCRTAAIGYVDARDRLIHGNTDAGATQLASLIRSGTP